MAWMQRLVDVPAALEGRGWAPGAEGATTLAIHDPLAPVPVSLRLEVSGGRARVTPGGDGAVVTDAATLASWYCGSLGALEARRAGLLEGSDAAVSLLDALLPRRELWLSEFF